MVEATLDSTGAFSAAIALRGACLCCCLLPAIRFGLGQASQFSEQPIKDDLS